MKVIKISEVTSGLEEIIEKKEQEKEQFLALRDEMNKVVNLDDALKGEGGDAIKEHFVTLELNAVLLFNLFLENYIKALKDIKNAVEGYESHDGLVRSNFIENEVANVLNHLDDATNTIADDMNSHYNTVSDLVPAARVSTYGFNLNLADARQHNEDTVEDLEKLDAESTSSLQAPNEMLDEIRQFITKIDSWTADGVFMTDQQLKEIEVYYAESEMLRRMIDNAVELSIKQGDMTGLGVIAALVERISKLNDYKDLLVSGTSLGILGAPFLEVTKDGNGNFSVTTSSKWMENTKFDTKLARNINKLLSYVSNNATNLIKSFLTVPKMPAIQIGLSMFTNVSEFYDDKNANKSTFEKAGRFAAGLGTDAGVAGLTAGGTAIGTIIAPGVGTIVGGLIGFGVGTLGKIIFGDGLKDFGEEIGGWFEDSLETIKDGIDDLFSEEGNFISRIFN